LQQSKHDCAVSPLATQPTQVPTVVSQTDVPASFRAKQSPSVLHSMHTPATLGLPVLPHTNASGSLPDLQDVPVGASLKQGVSGEGPQQAGLMRQAELETGMSVGSSTVVVPPPPLHTTFWQSPGVWSDAGAVVPPGYAHWPVVSQSVAPHAPTLPGQPKGEAQQWPLPVIPHAPDEH
jgi:hypothetical protein